MSSKYNSSDIVWVQVPGFPWWPAKVISPTSSGVSDNVLNGKQGKEDTLVQFFSTNDYSWAVSSDHASIRHFAQHTDLMTQPKVKTNVSLKKAINLAKKEYESTTGDKLSESTNSNNNNNNTDSKKSSTTTTTSKKKASSPVAKKRSRKRDEGSDYEQSDREGDDDEEEEDADANRKKQPAKKKVKKETTTATSTEKTSSSHKEATSTSASPSRNNNSKESKKSESGSKSSSEATSSTKKSEKPSTKEEKTPTKKTPKKEESKTSSLSASKSKTSKQTPKKKSETESNDSKSSKLTRVTLTDDQLEKCNAKLDRFIDDGNNEKILEAVRFLHSECEPLTIAQLTKVKIGKTMKKLMKSSDEIIAKYSSSLVRSWTQLVRDVQSGHKVGSSSNSSAPSTPTTPSTPSSRFNSNSSAGQVVEESLLDLTGDVMRDYARKKIANGLATGTSNHKKCANLAIMIEENMFDLHGRNSGDESYKTQVRSVAYNLADRSNEDFCEMVLTGQFAPSKVASMSSREMASKELKAERERIQKEATRESMTAQPAQTKTSMFTCRRCKSQNCTYYQMQTRSADEPMTVFVTCLNCDQRWKC